MIFLSLIFWGCISTASQWYVHLEMPTEIILSKLISQSTEFAGQVLELGLTGVGTLDLCGLKNLILLAPLRVNKPWGFD